MNPESGKSLKTLTTLTALVKSKLSFNFCSSEKENENDSADTQCNGNRVSDESDQKSGQPRSNVRAPLTQRGNLPTENEVRNDFQVQQVDTMSMMDQLSRELGELVY